MEFYNKDLCHVIKPCKECKHLTYLSASFIELIYDYMRTNYRPIYILLIY